MDDNGRAVVALARRFYLHYCGEKGWNPRPWPWSPLWAMEYARVAVDAYGYDDEGLSALEGEVNSVVSSGGK